MLNCREVTEHASDYLDGAGALRFRMMMRLHLTMCRICREYVRQMALVIGALERMPRQNPTVSISPPLLDAFRAGRR